MASVGGGPRRRRPAAARLARLQERVHARAHQLLVLGNLRRHPTVYGLDVAPLRVEEDDDRDARARRELRERLRVGVAQDRNGQLALFRVMLEEVVGSLLFAFDADPEETDGLARV